jgi:TonB family protein
VTLLAGLAIRSAVVLGAGLLLTACLSQRSAALRHRVLVATLVSAALVFPFSLALPAWNVALPAGLIDTRAPAPAPAEAAAPASAIPASALESLPGPPAAPPNRAAAFAMTWPLVTIWLAGVLVALGALATALLRVRRIAARAARIDDPQWLRLLDEVAARYRLTRAVVIKRIDAPGLLATWGVRRPQVLVPRDAGDWTLDRVHVVLCHELAHIRRHDWVVQMAAETLCAILWFNPLAWMVCARLRRESELACDDEVLGAGVGGRDYAAQLLALARAFRQTRSPWTSALPMAHPSTLERRIAAMLNPHLDRQVPSRRALTLLVVVVMLVTLPLAALRARQAGPAPLSGTIYDVSGGVLPGVEVALVDANNDKWVATSNASGRFALPAVGPGKYVLEARIAGFRALRQPFELREAGDWDRAVMLQVGDLSETVVVRSSRGSVPKPVDAAAPRQPAPVRVGGNVRPPRKIRDVRPVYPPSMREAGLTGVVPIEAVIGRDGTVASVRVLSAPVHPDLAIAAVDAVRQWRFTPTLLNGVAVDVVMTVSVRFDLEG